MKELSAKWLVVVNGFRCAGISGVLDGSDKKTWMFQKITLVKKWKGSFQVIAIIRLDVYVTVTLLQDHPPSLSFRFQR